MCGRYTITDWALSERPREKFIERGAESLTDSELLAILIRAGNREDNAIELARKYGEKDQISYAKDEFIALLVDQIKNLK